MHRRSAPRRIIMAPGRSAMIRFRSAFRRAHIDLPPVPMPET